MHYFSPLRYPGGKGKLAPFIKQLLRYNNLLDCTYVEPYAGGAAVALSLLLEGYAWDIVINDIDPIVHAFWWSVLNDTEALIQKIKRTPVTINAWRKQKEVHADPDLYSKTDVAFATFFLNRTNRSGILKAGVIGGQKQDGPYKLDARFNKNDLIERILLISKYKGRIHLYHMDAYELINVLAPSLTKDSMVYFDPPYFNKGKMLYRNFYTINDHAQMAALIRSLNLPWIVTYDNVQEINDLYSGEEFAEFDISYSAHLSRPRGKEVMYYKNLALPSDPYARKESEIEALQN